MDVQEFLQELVKEYIKSGIYNLEFENNLLHKLFADRNYPLILLCFSSQNSTLFPFDSQYEQDILESGNFELYKYLYSNRPSQLTHLLFKSLELGNIEFLDWSWNISEAQNFWQSFERIHFIVCNPYVIAKEFNQEEILNWLIIHNISGSQYRDYVDVEWT